MYVSFANPFKCELKFALFTVYWHKRETEYGTIDRGFSITILNLTIIHSWITDKKK